ncbi:hypothetical protein GCM10011581_22320 [Saccharopolyspora subtropica]|uniref:UspA domain-containing protein n=1 Tax=Saccharopolyspora thermophila TaxID=89367 RepID=A0A917JSU0_9PSEU|nr:hypothetical protein GCM10011581_22320 [Saccharopolyspora subtropica]
MRGAARSTTLVSCAEGGSRVNGAPVVVGIDGSAVAENAARWAAREAARLGTGLRIVYADVTEAPLLPEIPGLHWPKEHRGHVREQVARYLDRNARSARQQAPQVSVEVACEPGFPDKVLIEESRTARAVVVGDRGFGGFTGLLAGSVAVRVATHAHTRVVVVPDVGDPPTFPVTGPVVAGVDDATSAVPVLAHAFEVAADWDAPLHVVHTWEVIGTDVRRLLSRTAADQVQEREEGFVADLLADWSPRFPDVEVHSFVAHGSPSAELLTRAKGAQLVVVGARGRGGVSGAHLGTTSHKLLHHSPCPVAVIR